MNKKVKIINLEAGMPTVDVGRKRLYLEMSAARNQGIKYLKVIHGYGSSGVGGRLKHGIWEFLTEMKRDGMVKAFVPGENWSIFDQTARYIIEQCDELRKDSDLDNSNPGITIVML